MVNLWGRTTARSFSEHLMCALSKKEFGLKLSPEKRQFFKMSVRYLGHVVTEKEVETDLEKIADLTTWPKPKT